MSKVFAFLKDESGATAIEYRLIGSTLNGKFTDISTQLK
jgi:Flp pilus assembly pilin Flp